MKSLVESAPRLIDFLGSESLGHFQGLQAILQANGIAYTINPRLVRGLDYYTRTTFELVHHQLGAQSSFGGGGRYNGLVEAIGGPSAPGVGYGMGVDRSLLACEAEGIDLAPGSRVDVFGVPLGEQAKSTLVRLLGAARRAGLRCDLAYGNRGMKGAMKAADRSGARFAVVLGERDLLTGAAQVKDLGTGDQVAVPIDQVVGHLLEAVATP